MPPVRVVTFDLWDTFIIDESDEPKRLAQGLEPKPIARRSLVYEALSRHHDVSRREVELAYDVADAAFRRVWHDQAVTWEVAERIDVVLKGLGLDLPDAELAEVVRAHEEMELEVRPDLVPNLRELLLPLKERYALAVVSDTIFSPGWALRKLLESVDVLDLFDAFAFSDEVGRSKPDRAMFDAITSKLGVDVTEIVHVGDREHNDVDGPHRLGARAILTTVIKDRRDGTATKAEAVCTDYNDLSTILASLSSDVS